MTPLDERGKLLAGLLAERYEFVGFLGKGGFASVYKVRSLVLGRFEALKVLHDARLEDTGFSERFRREARVAASLEHPSIVKVFDFGDASGNFWYSMQLIDGPTVSRELKIRGRLDEEKTLRIAIPILDALEYSHVRGVVHRDIKPDNIILDAWDRPYLMDFGIAKLDDDMVKTAAGQTLGSPAYLSPEQARGLPLDGRSDVYSLGITLYQMVSGVVPFAGPDKLAAIARRVMEDPEPVSKHRPDVHPGIERAILKALARDLDTRFASARDMREELEGLLEEIAPRTAGRRTVRTPQATGIERPAVPGAWGLDSSSSGDLGTQLNVPTDPLRSAHGAATTGSNTLGPFRRGRHGWLWGAAAGAVAALVVVLLMRRTMVPAPAGTAPASAPTPSFGVPAPSGAPPGAAAPGPAPAVQAPVPEAAPTSPAREPAVKTGAAPAGPAYQVTPQKSPREGPRAARAEPKTERPPRRQLPVAAAAPTSRPAPRRAKYPPDIEEQPDVTLSPQLAAECAGRTVGVSVIVQENGSLKTSKVISSVSPACDAAALEMLGRYRFKPALDEEGKPVEARFSFAVRF